MIPIGINISTAYNYNSGNRHYTYQGEFVNGDFNLVFVIIKGDLFYSYRTTIKDNYHQTNTNPDILPFPYYKENGIDLITVHSHEYHELWAILSEDDFNTFYKMFVNIHTNKNYAIINIKHENAQIRNLCKNAIESLK